MLGYGTALFMSNAILPPRPFAYDIANIFRKSPLALLDALHRGLLPPTPPLLCLRFKIPAWGRSAPRASGSPSSCLASRPPRCL